MTQLKLWDQVFLLSGAYMATDFEPKIVGFLCNWCSYAGADKAGTAQNPYPPNVNVVRVMCSGRVDPQFVMNVFEKGADGVLILACHPGDCHYKEGNYRAAQRYRILIKLLAQLGIEEGRCRFDYVSASEGDKFVSVITDMVNTIKKLGPLRLAGEAKCFSS
jgi:F420-non-reducing hydrogenase iron-sulfur subunit